jgi:hypothetical protein
MLTCGTLLVNTNLTPKGSDVMDVCGQCGSDRLEYEDTSLVIGYDKNGKEERVPGYTLECKDCNNVDLYAK